MPIDYTSVDEIRREFIPSLSTAEQPALGKIVGFASRSIERYCNRYFWTTTGDETRDFDGPRKTSRTFDPGIDIAAVTTLQLSADSAAAASGTRTTISTGDYFLQAANRLDQWPAQRIELIEDPTGTYANSSQPYMFFEPGLRNVRIIGRFGWNTTTVDSTQFPQEIRQVAIELATRLWRSKDAGYSNVIGVSEIGTAVIERIISPWSRDILEFYKRPSSR